MPFHIQHTLSFSFSSDPDVKFMRWISDTSWHPDLPNIIAAAYTTLPSGSTSSVHGSQNSYVWDFQNPYFPVVCIDMYILFSHRIIFFIFSISFQATLIPPSPLNCLQFNPKEPNILVGGCYNGLICVYIR